MPGPLIRDPFTSPAVPGAVRSARDWVDQPTPEGWWSQPQENPGAGVLEQIIKMLIGATGVTDPASQAMAMGAPMELPAAGTASRGASRTVPQLTPLHETIQHAGGSNYALRDPNLERVIELYKQGNALPNQSNWSGSGHDELMRAFGNNEDEAQTWARRWAATSPNTSVPVNTRESVISQAWALEHPGEQLTNEMARSWGPESITMAGSKVPNLNLANTGQKLGGDKVNAMAEFMLGKPRIPLDVHAIHAVGSHAENMDEAAGGLRGMMTSAEGLPMKTARKNTLQPTDLYTRYEAALRNALEDIAPGRNLNQVFAELWEGTRAFKGLKPQGGPIDILRQKGLLEYGAMLDPQRLRAALRQAGWTAGAVTGLMSAMDEPRMMSSHGDTK